MYDKRTPVPHREYNDHYTPLNLSDAAKPKTNLGPSRAPSTMSWTIPDPIPAGSSPEWPANMSGFICKTPPTGPASAPRFAQCCSGTVYNITSPTSPGDPGYPVSAATLCQVDPALAQNDPKYPFEWSEHFMCLTNGGKEPSYWSVTCANVTMPSNPAPTSFIHSPTGWWITKSWDHDRMGFFRPFASTASDTQPPTMEAITGFWEGLLGPKTSTSTSTSQTVTSASVTPTISSPPSSLMESAAAASSTATATTTSTSSGSTLSFGMIATMLLVVSVFRVGLETV